MPNIPTTLASFLEQCPDDVDVLEYKGMTKLCVWQCVRCKKTYTDDTPDKIRRRKVNCRCNGFAGSIPVSVFIDELEKANLPYEVLSYKAYGKKAELRCSEGHVFEATPFHIIDRRNSCLLCSKTNRHSKASDEYSIRLARTFPNITLDQPYIDFRTPIIHKCSCGYSWKSKPFIGKQGRRKAGCKFCDYSSGGPKLKEVQFGNRVVTVQGFEKQALQYLEAETNINPKYLAVSKSDGVPNIRYYYKYKERLYIPDFYYLPKNRIVEVKSIFTLLCIDYCKTVAKALACMEQGFDFKLMVPIGENGHTLFKIPKSWYLMSRMELGKYLCEKHPKHKKWILRLLRSKRNVFK